MRAREIHQPKQHGKTTPDMRKATQATALKSRANWGRSWKWSTSSICNNRPTTDCWVDGSTSWRQILFSTLNWVRSWFSTLNWVLIWANWSRIVLFKLPNMGPNKILGSSATNFWAKEYLNKILGSSATNFWASYMGKKNYQFIPYQLLELKMHQLKNTWNKFKMPCP